MHVNVSTIALVAVDWPTPFAIGGLPDHPELKDCRVTGARESGVEVSLIDCPWSPGGHI